MLNMVLIRKVNILNILEEKERKIWINKKYQAVDHIVINTRMNILQIWQKITHLSNYLSVMFVGTKNIKKVPMCSYG